LNNKTGSKVGQPNDKENDKIYKALKYEGESEKRVSSWLAPNVENLTRILNPFQMSFSMNSEVSLEEESQNMSPEKKKVVKDNVSFESDEETQDCRLGCE